jgi:hypothetical protein
MAGKSLEQIRRAAGATIATMQCDHLPNATAETPILVLLDLIELGTLDLASKWFCAHHWLIAGLAHGDRLGSGLIIATR